MTTGIRRILILIAVAMLAVLCVAVVVACGDRALQKLPTPDWPQRDGSAVVWNDDPKYKVFVVSIDGTEYQTYDNTYDIAFATKEGKAFEVKVKALGDGKYYADSDWSKSLTIAPIALTMEKIQNKDEYKIKECKTALGDIVLPQTYNGLPVTEIGYGAFEDCNDITSVSIPYGITVISVGAFDNCTNLERVIIPDSVAKIYNYAFAQCEKLKTINIPQSVSYIGDNIFKQSGMANLSVAADNQYYRTEGNCLIRRSDNTLLFANENSTIPSNVDTIAQYAIWSDKVEIVVMPDGVKKFAQQSFYCSNLKRVIVPASVEEIAKNAFYSANIAELIVDDENAVYKSDCGHIIRKSDNVLISGCSGNIVIPDYVTGIAEYAFYRRNTQSTLFIPKSVTWIGHNGFFGCKNLKYVYLPNTLKELGYAFCWLTDNNGNYVSGTRSVTIPEGCVWDNVGTIAFSSHDCEIGYDDGYAYVLSYSVVYSKISVEYGLIKDIIEYDADADNSSFPYRYGYTLGGFSVTPNGNSITTVEEIEQNLFTENNITKVRVYPIWIANE